MNFKDMNQIAKSNISQLSITINNKVFNYVKTREYAPVSIFKSDDEFLRIGPKGLLEPELAFQKKLLNYGFPVPKIRAEGEYNGEFYFKELLDGDSVLTLFCEECSILNAESFRNKRYASDILEASEEDSLSRNDNPVSPVVPESEPILATSQEDCETLEDLGLGWMKINAGESVRYFRLDLLCNEDWALRPELRGETSLYYCSGLDQQERSELVFDSNICKLVLITLREILQLMHQHGFYAVTLKPQDIAVNLFRLSPLQAKNQSGVSPINPSAKMFVDGTGEILVACVKLLNHDVWENVDSGFGNGFEVDQKYIHPKHVNGMYFGHKETMLAQDWFSFATLAANLLTKADPFSVGTVISNPKVSSDRILRMREALFFWDSERCICPEYFNAFANLELNLKKVLNSYLQGSNFVTFPESCL